MFWANDGLHGAEPWVTPAPRPREASVVAAHAFYNNSAFDDARSLDAADDAIAADKSPLLPGQNATFANVTNYPKGINGVMVDVSRLPGGNDLSAADFDFGGALPPASVMVRRGAGRAGPTASR